MAVSNNNPKCLLGNITTSVVIMRYRVGLEPLYKELIQPVYMAPGDILTVCAALQMYSEVLLWYIEFYYSSQCVTSVKNIIQRKENDSLYSQLKKSPNYVIYLINTIKNYNYKSFEVCPCVIKQHNNSINHKADCIIGMIGITWSEATYQCRAPRIVK